MKLIELLTTNASICKLTIDVRKRDLHLIKSYHIGLYEREDRYADINHGILPRWEVIKAPINSKDMGKDYWGVIIKDIPKKLLDLEVARWDLWYGYSSNNGLNKHMWLNVDVYGEDVALPELKKETHENIENSQLSFLEMI